MVPVGVASARRSPKEAKDAGIGSQSFQVTFEFARIVTVVPTA
jgi:hypothetical protein